MSDAVTIDITSPAFARRLANLLKDRRATSRVTLRELVRRSDRNFDIRFLRAAEDGRAPLDEQTVCELAALYGAELADILPSRLPLRIEVASDDASSGIVSTSGISAQFDPARPDSLLTSYLMLVRQLRAQQHEPLIDLRREDVELLAEFLDEPGPSVVERLSTLMGATQLQRRAMVGMFVAGAIVIGLAGSGVAAFTGTTGGSPPARPAIAIEADPGPTEVSEDAEPPPQRPAPRETSAPATTAITAVDEPAASPRSEPLDGAPGLHAPTTSLVVVVVPAEPEPHAASPDTTAVADAPRGTDPRVDSDPPTPEAEPVRSPPVAAPPTATVASIPEIATGPPPLEEPDTAGAVPPAPQETVPDPTIPDLPFDPPPTTAAPTVETTVVPPPAPPPPVDVGPATGPPPVPSTTVRVETGEPPVPHQATP